MAGRRAAKSKSKAKPAKRATKKKAATKKGGRAKGATKRIAKKGRGKKSVENPEEIRREMVFRVQKSYKNSGLLNLQELIDDGKGRNSISSRDNNKYNSAAKDLIRDYKNKSFEGSGIVFSQRVFENLQARANLES